jgi:two-component system, chemotaxis family, chemotaxis protein CheY
MQTATAAQPTVQTVPSILIVDGEPDTRLLYKTVFDGLASTVVEAEDGAEALGKAICARPDVILTDSHLRRVDGYALCALLRNDPSTRSAAIVIVTGAALPAEIARAVKAGADEVVVKPCTPEAMIAAVQRAIQHRATAGNGNGVAPAGAAPGDAPPRRAMKSRIFNRHVTTVPPNAPPALRCPNCDQTLVYQSSHVGGVSERFAEQWDHFTCPDCGVFRYRHRTRKLTPGG